MGALGVAEFSTADLRPMGAARVLAMPMTNGLMGSDGRAFGVLGPELGNSAEAARRTDAVLPGGVLTFYGVWRKMLFMTPDIALGLARLEEVCRLRGLAVTHQRRVVFEELLGRSDHPTADQVYEAVAARLPRVSRRTVYRVLDTLAEIGLVRRVHHCGVAVRFDAKTGRHHHLVCTQCQRIVDFEDELLNNLSLPQGRPRGFDLCDFSVQLMGVCPQCRRENQHRSFRRKKHV